MTGLQKHIMQLMREIDETCAENDIPYALYGRTAGCALKDGKFTTGCYQFQIMMSAGDIIVLKEKLTEKYTIHRGIEDFSVNPRLQYHYVRYVDTHTTVFDKNYPVDYIMPGVAVTIIPLFTKKISKLCEALETGMIYLNGHKVIREQAKTKKAKRSRKCIWITRQMQKIFGDKWVAGKIYRTLENEKGMKTGETLFLRGDDNTKFADFKLKIKSGFLTDTIRIPFEGMKLPVSVDSEEFFEILYGPDWRETAEYPLPTINHMNVIWDDGAPFSDYLSLFQEKGIDMAEIFDSQRKYNYFYENIYETWRKKAGRYLRYGRRSVDRIDLYCFYKNKMSEIKKSVDEDDMEYLNILMEPYMEAVRKYKRYGIEFYINDELHYYAGLVWEKTEGKEKYGEQIYAATPDAYKTKDMDEFLKNYI